MLYDESSRVVRFNVRKSDLPPEDWADIKKLVETERPDRVDPDGTKSWKLSYGVPNKDWLQMRSRGEAMYGAGWPYRNLGSKNRPGDHEAYCRDLEWLKELEAQLEKKWHVFDLF